MRANYRANVNRRGKQMMGQLKKTIGIAAEVIVDY
jgi:hypothetical protein